MTASRRNFLKTGATAALIVGIPAKLILGQRAKAVQPDYPGGLELPIQSQSDYLAHLRRSSFTPYVNSIFEVRVKRGPFSRSVPLRLTSVRGMAPERKRLGRTKPISAGTEDEETFSLLFSGSVRTPLVQNVYDIHHPALGKMMNLLLVRVVDEDNQAGYYQVIFNRSRP